MILVRNTISRLPINPIFHFCRITLYRSDFYCAKVISLALSSWNIGIRCVSLYDTDEKFQCLALYPGQDSPQLFQTTTTYLSLNMELIFIAIFSTRSYNDSIHYSSDCHGDGYENKKHGQLVAVASSEQFAERKLILNGLLDDVLNLSEGFQDRLTQTP